MKVRKYQSESHLQCPKPEGWACKKLKNLKMIDSANKLSGCFDRKRCSQSTLRRGKAQGHHGRSLSPRLRGTKIIATLKEINDNLRVLNTLYN